MVYAYGGMGSGGGKGGGLRGTGLIRYHYIHYTHQVVEDLQVQQLVPPQIHHLYQYRGIKRYKEVYCIKDSIISGFNI
jgi:hypothetical protein